jgi:HAD superfamily hydrolase (TIGR01484 family)
MTTLKMAIFDVDGTICGLGRKLGEPVAPDVAVRLRALEHRGSKVVLATGRPAQFALGIALGIGLENPIIVGDNGCVICDLAEEKETFLAIRTAELQKLMDELVDLYGFEIRLAPNQVSCTVFPKKGTRLKSGIKGLVRQHVLDSRGRLHMFEHNSAIDILPGGVDKGVAIELLMETFGINKSETLAVGDGLNDIPMFSKVGLPLIIGSLIDYPGAYHCDSIGDALLIAEDRFDSSQLHSYEAAGNKILYNRTRDHLVRSSMVS